MTQPKRLPKQPRPIADDPHAGQHAVVVTFRVADLGQPVDLWLRDVRDALRLATEDNGGHAHDLTVHVRVIGAGGERSEQEGLGGHALTEDIGPVRATENVNPGERL